jgi:hypothetical protein
MKPLVFATCTKDVLEAKLQEHEVNDLYVFYLCCMHLCFFEFLKVSLRS